MELLPCYYQMLISLQSYMKDLILLVKKKEDSLAEAKKKEVGTEINYNQFKTRFAQQSVKSEALLKKYLDLLPR